jgi:hypothetical protein
VGRGTPTPASTPSAATRPHGRGRGSRSSSDGCGLRPNGPAVWKTAGLRGLRRTITPARCIWVVRGQPHRDEASVQLAGPRQLAHLRSASRAAKAVLTPDSCSSRARTRGVEPTLGFEPRTCCLRNSCSTAELCRRRPRIADAFRQQLLLSLSLSRRIDRERARMASTTLEQLITVGGTLGPVARPESK